MGTAKGKKIKIATIKKKLNEKGLYEFRHRFVPEETKELVKNYLLDNDKWKTISTPQVIEDLNLQEWLNHLQEELMDATLYIERLKAEVGN